MNYVEIKDLIVRYKNKVNMKLCSNDYAKGYCYGALALSKNINKETYDELVREIDDVFDAEEKKQTNADRIRSMTDEELAEFLCKISKCNSYYCPAYDYCINQRKSMYEWLKSDSEV